MLFTTIGLGLWWGCSAQPPGTASFLTSPFTSEQWRQKASMEVPTDPLGMPAWAIWTSLVFFPPEQGPVVPLDWAEIASVNMQPLWVMENPFFIKRVCLKAGNQALVFVLRNRLAGLRECWVCSFSNHKDVPLTIELWKTKASNSFDCSSAAKEKKSRS